MWISEDGEIKYIKFDDYVSFMLGAKAENNELFKTFCNNAECVTNEKERIVPFNVV